MTEILSLAQKVAETKEDIKKAINERGIAVDDTIPFSQYPQKIKEIARDPAFNARNDLGVTEIESGTKVLIQPLEQQGGLVKKFSNALDKANWGALCLYPSSTTKMMCDNRRGGDAGVYSWTEETGLEAVYTTTTDVSTSTRNLNTAGLKFLSNNLVLRITTNSNSSITNQYYWTPDGVVTGTPYQYIYNDGYGVKNAANNNWTLWKVNENGEFTEQVGQDVVGSALGQYPLYIYVSPNGQYIINANSLDLWKNDGGAINRIVNDDLPDLRTILSSKNYYQVLGGTSDGKFMIVNRYADNADSNGVKNFPAIIEMSNDYQTYTELTDFAITGLPTWYSWLQTLCVKNAQGVVRMFKYADGKWEEISIDFPDTFTSGQDGRVTLNYDGSQICVTDSTSDNAGAVYLYNLEVTANGYKAVPYTPHNFNTKSYTAYATGNITANTVEVNALLPTLDNLEYDDGRVEVHPVQPM